MIHLLGGSVHIGQAYQALFTRKSISFHNLKCPEIDYTNFGALYGALRTDCPGFLINAAGHTGKPNASACVIHKAKCLFATP